MTKQVIWVKGVLIQNTYMQIIEHRSHIDELRNAATLIGSVWEICAKFTSNKDNEDVFNLASIIVDVALANLLTIEDLFSRNLFVSQLEVDELMSEIVHIKVQSATHIGPFPPLDAFLHKIMAACQPALGASHAGVTTYIVAKAFYDVCRPVFELQQVKAVIK